MNYELRIKNIFLFLIFILLIFIDQFSKYLIRSHGGFYICNKGIAFGLVIPNYLFLLLWSVIIILLIIHLISKFKVQNSNQNQIIKSKKFNFWILDFIWNNLDFEIWILILSGAISNIIDRLYLGCVIDFIDIKIWPIFNLADSFITLGAILLLFSFIKKGHDH